MRHPRMQLGCGCDKIAMTFLNVESRGHADQRGICSETQFLSQGFASRGIRLKYSKVEAIGNDFHFVFVVAEFGVRHTRGFRTANDALGQPGRKDFADPRGPDGEPLVLPGIQIRMMNSPDDRLSSKTRSKSAQEIGVVHPRLYQIRLRFL